MSRRGLPIGRIFGISIDLDYSWFLIVALLAWMLAVGYFPAAYRGWSQGEYWALGIAAAVLLFACVLIHELAHSLMALHYGIPVPRITLFLFGGVSQIAKEPPAPAVEFWIAIVGPLTSLGLAAGCWALASVLSPSPALALAHYLAWINLILALFNLVPGFPLDGGRVLRAIIWRVTHSYHRATTIAAMTGRFFGFLLIFWGVWQVLAGRVGNGLWIAIIGWFLESAASSQLQQETLRTLLEGHHVAEAMQRDFVQAPGEESLQELVEHELAHARYAVVTRFGAPAGLITLSALREVPRQEWPVTPAARIMIPLQKLHTTQPGAILWSALEKMGRDGVNQLPVLDGNGVVGVLSREDIVHYITRLGMMSA